MVALYQKLTCFLFCFEFDTIITLLKIPYLIRTSAVEDGRPVRYYCQTYYRRSNGAINNSSSDFSDPLLTPIHILLCAGKTTIKLKDRANWSSPCWVTQAWWTDSLVQLALLLSSDLISYIFFFKLTVFSLFPSQSCILFLVYIFHFHFHFRYDIMMVAILRAKNSEFPYPSVQVRGALGVRKHKT